MEGISDIFTCSSYTLTVAAAIPTSKVVADEAFVTTSSNLRPVAEAFISIIVVKDCCEAVVDTLYVEPTATPSTDNCIVHVPPDSLKANPSIRIVCLNSLVTKYVLFVTVAELCSQTLKNGMVIVENVSGN